MSNSALLEAYQGLNDSYRKRLVFHMGYEAGFFSEYNNMLLAMLYCLAHKIRFSIYSGDANFAFDKGWQDYFNPFCEEFSKFRFPIARETNASFQKKYNKRNHSELRLQYGRKDRFKISIYKLLNGVDYLTQDVWLELRDNRLLDSFYDIPELGIEGDIRQACSRLIDLTWNFNDDTRIETNKWIESLNLPVEYIGLHIRQGDKQTEDDLQGPLAYIRKAENLSSIRNAFVSTDDYRVISLLKENCPEWDIFTLCPKEEQGYVHSDFLTQTVDYKKRHYYEFFSSVDVLSRSCFFIGTFSSNLGMFMGLRLPKEKCYGIDRDNWLIW